MPRPTAVARSPKTSAVVPESPRKIALFGQIVFAERYSALDGLRYSGLGAVSFGVFAAGLILGSACLSQRLVVRRWRPLTVLVVGLAGAILVGAPGLGADPGSAIALMVGVCVASALAKKNSRARASGSHCACASKRRRTMKRRSGAMSIRWWR